MAKWKPGGPGRPPASARARQRKPAKAARVSRPRRNPTARAMGRRGGAAGTAKQHAARKRNAVKAGRPGKVCIFCGEPAKGGHKSVRLDATCGMHGWTYRQRAANEPPITAEAINAEIEALVRLRLQLELTATPEPEPFAPPEETPGAPLQAPPDIEVPEEPRSAFDPLAPGADTVIHDHRESPDQPASEERVPF